MTRRIGTCPILTERTGKKTGHTMIPQRVYCTTCPESSYSGRDTRDFCTKRTHESYRRCSSCTYEERDWHPCDQIINSYVGNWPSSRHCDKKGIELRNERKDFLDTPKGKFWLCKRHFPENVEQKEKEKRRRENIRYEVSMDKSRYGWVGRGYEKILLEMAGWMALNHEHVAEDEWLQKIADMMADNEQLMKVLTEEKS